MALPPELASAYAKLDEAITELRKAYGYEDFLTGWVLLTSSVEMQDNSTHDSECVCDELDLRSAGGWYTKRGQDPTLSYGIVNEGLRHYNEIQVHYGESD